MRDCINQPVEVDDFIAVAGRGNSTAEYGLIVGKVTKISKDKVSFTRLRVSYHDHKTPTISHIKTTVSSGKFVKVNPGPEITGLFNTSFSFTAAESKVVAKWLHKGTLEI